MCNGGIAKLSQCKLLHRAHVSTDEFEVDEDGCAYDPHSDNSSNFEEEQQEQGNEEDFNDHSQYGAYNVMVRFLDSLEEKACVVHQHSF